jgi:hypothetical protein
MYSLDFMQSIKTIYQYSENIFFVNPPLISKKHNHFNLNQFDFA